MNRVGLQMLKGRPGTGLGLALVFLRAALAPAAVWVEDFAADPVTRGWRVAGQSNLFQWNATGQNLAVTWDSRQPNSFFYLPLGMVLTRSDDFRLEFDLRLAAITPGIDPAKPYTFEIAFGLTAQRNLTNINFYRGAGVNPAYGPRDLVELDYFPAASAVTATVAPTIVYSNNRFDYSHNFPLEITVGGWFRIQMTYHASNQVLRTRLWRNGQPYGAPDGWLHDIVLTNSFDFAVDTLAVSSYNDGLQSPVFAGSVWAQGELDNFLLAAQPWPEGRLAVCRTPGGWAVAFPSHSGWRHTVQRSSDLLEWSDVSGEIPGVEGRLVWEDTAGDAPARAFYRVRTQRP